MNTLISEPMAKTVSFNKSNMMIDLVDGRKLSVPLAFFGDFPVIVETQMVSSVNLHNSVT